MTMYIVVGNEMYFVQCSFTRNQVRGLYAFEYSRQYRDVVWC